MILTRLELRNFCQHRSRDITFSPHLNMIIGSNGAGKTNLLRGIQLALTGSATVTGTKADDITQNSSGYSFVALTMTHGGNNYYIRRGLRGVSSTLLVNDEMTTRTTKEISDVLLTALDTTKQQIDDYVFVKQRGVDAWLDKRDADRAKELTALFQLRLAEDIWERLGNYVTAIEIAPHTDIAPYAQQFNAAMVAAEQAEAELAALSHVPTDVTPHSKLFSDLSKQYDIQQYNVRNRLACKERLDEVTEDIATSNKQLLIIDDTVQRLRQGQAALIPRETLVQQRELWQRVMALRQIENVMATRKRSIGAKFAARPKLVPQPMTDTEYAAVLRQHDLAYNKFVSLSSDIDRLSRLTIGAPCPLCNKPTDDVKDMLYLLRCNKLKCDDELRALDARRAQYITYLAQREAHAELLRELRGMIADTRQGVAAVQDVLQPTMELADIAHIERQHDDFAGGLMLFEQDRVRESTALQGSLRRRDELQTQIEQFDTALAQQPQVTPEMVVAAQTAFNAVCASMRQRDELRTRVAVAKQTVHAARERLDNAVSCNVQRDRTVQSKAYMENLRAIFHRGALPRIVAYTYLERMQNDINEMLVLFDAPFRVRTTEDLGYEAIFSDGRCVPDRRLSVGERIVLSLALRITINSTFASSLGVLLMDEPTAGLDEHNLGCLPRALERLRGVSDTFGLQVLFVTHEPRISHLFDKVINLHDC